MFEAPPEEGKYYYIKDHTTCTHPAYNKQTGLCGKAAILTYDYWSDDEVEVKD